MIKLRINAIEIEVRKGSTILEAAAAAGFEIPTMCNNGAVEHFASCMVCLVKDATNGSFMPSCATRVQEGMNLITQDATLTEARKTALELLLSEHVGDCEAPCRVACPAFMDIPLMNRLIAAGKMEEAYQVVKTDIALPGVLGRICPAPCENACRRKSIDKAVAICLLKRFTADASIAVSTEKPAITFAEKVCIIGAGPAGLSAAYYLQQKGIQTVIYDGNELPGGALRYVLEDEVLDKSVLDREIDCIRQMGAVFEQQQKIDAFRFKTLCHEFDAVVLATGNFRDEMLDWGLDNDGKHLLADKATHRTNLKNVFAIGNTTRAAKMAIRSAAQGKEVAVVLEQLFQAERRKDESRDMMILTGSNEQSSIPAFNKVHAIRSTQAAVIGRLKFNSSFGKLLEVEFSEYLKETTDTERQHAGIHSKEGFSREKAILEAQRCMHCDCRKADHCVLRELSDRYKASQKRYFQTDRLPVVKKIAYENLIYEPGKCIKCGVCVRITAKYKETFGFTFVGRGFNVEIGIPFNEKMELALVHTMGLVAKACPTGALSSIAKELGTSV